MKETLVKSFAYHYPLTAAGTLLLAAALYLLGRGLAQENPYGLLLSVLALILLAASSIAARLQAQRFRLHQPHWHWDSSGALYARRVGSSQTLITDNVPTLPFFRIHFQLNGILKAGREAGLRIGREISFAHGTRHSIDMYFPVCGLYSCRGRFFVRDIFGLSRARFGEQMQSRLSIQPASFTQKSIPLVDPSVGFEETSRRRSSDVEKYYMREYLPGDRFRDINWKVSSRLDELITRISPVTQEKTTILPVLLRNFRDEERESLPSIMHLNVLKSWLMAFLRAMKREYPEMQFRVASGSGVWLLETDEDIERFSWELAGMYFRREAGAESPLPPEEQLFVFSTAFDRGLPLFISSQAQARVFVFRTVAARPGEEESADPVSLFQPACACLPGAWILRRETAAKPPGIPLSLQSRLEEHALSVRVFQ